MLTGVLEALVAGATSPYRRYNAKIPTPCPMLFWPESDIVGTMEMPQPDPSPPVASPRTTGTLATLSKELTMDSQSSDGPIEIAMVGDLTDHETDITERLLSVEPGGECTIYIDSPGGSPYCAISLMSLIKLRDLRATGVVTGECSSATLWPFAACRRRLVTPFSVLLFHPMKWQSEEHVGLAEAAEWARHFGQLEQDMDDLLADLFGVPHDMMNRWISPGRYVSGREIAEAGLAEMIDLTTIDQFRTNGAAAKSNAVGRGKPRVAVQK
ncbi:MAG: ATP-dependent Clp protease proteolytic subunit [Pirellulales bacterium]